MPEKGIFIYTDGSGDAGEFSACASVLVDRANKRRLKVCMLIDSVRGPDAELFGGIVGLISAEVCGYPAARQIRWCLDSKAVIAQAEAIRRGGAPGSARWGCWEGLAKNRAIEIQWIRGHHGHRENEACDRACSWIRRRGEEFLRERGEGPVGLASKKEQGSSWLFFDARDLGRTLTENLPFEGALDALRIKLSACLAER